MTDDSNHWLAKRKGKKKANLQTQRANMTYIYRNVIL